jgi:hypothetical protein
VPADPSFRRGIAQSGAGAMALDPTAAADALREPIALKERKLGRGDRQTILLLDAADAVALAMPATRRAFRERHGEWADKVGFEAIWVVGRTTSACQRLDAAS